MGVLSLDEKDIRYYVTSDFNKIFKAKPLIYGNTVSNYYLLCEEMFVKDSKKSSFTNIGYVNKMVVRSDTNMFEDFESAKLISELNDDE